MDNFLIVSHGEYAKATLASCEMIAGKLSNVKAIAFKQTMNQAPQTTPEAGKQMKTMLYVMLVIIVYASLTLPTALAFYWIVTYAFIAIQNIVINMFNNRSLTNKPRKKKEEKKKEKIKEKLIKKEGMKYGKNS